MADKNKIYNGTAEEWSEMLKHKIIIRSQGKKKKNIVDKKLKQERIQQTEKKSPQWTNPNTTTHSLYKTTDLSTGK